MSTNEPEDVKLLRNWTKFLNDTQSQPLVITTRHLEPVFRYIDQLHAELSVRRAEGGGAPRGPELNEQLKQP